MVSLSKTMDRCKTRIYSNMCVSTEKTSIIIFSHNGFFHTYTCKNLVQYFRCNLYNLNISSKHFIFCIFIIFIFLYFIFFILFSSKYFMYKWYLHKHILTLLLSCLHIFKMYTLLHYVTFNFNKIVLWIYIKWLYYTRVEDETAKKSSTCFEIKYLTSFDNFFMFPVPKYLTSISTKRGHTRVWKSNICKRNIL